MFQHSFNHQDFIYPRLSFDGYWMYDLETYPNIFTSTFYNVASGDVRAFEISTRVNHIAELLAFLDAQSSNTHIGFNNMGFDYPIIHTILKRGTNITLNELYQVAQGIIDTPWSNRFDNVIWKPDIRQIDLMKLMHMDGRASSTSLKMLECRMNMSSIKDLPFPPAHPVPNDGFDVLLDYNFHDVLATSYFFHEVLSEIKFRAELGRKYNLDFTNDSDTKIGAKVFKAKLHASNIECNKHLRTPRDKIVLSECILPNIRITLPEFQAIKDDFASLTITTTTGVFVDKVAWVKGIEYVFGVGGLHAAAQNKTFEESESHFIMLADVKSYYPNLSIKNKFYPEHLGVGFCTVNDEVYQERAKHPKGSVENAALKVALNATYGNSNQQFSDFYDPKFTMTTTISGQLTLLMLIEPLVQIEGLEIINVNTDGVCFIAPKNKKIVINEICKWWELTTSLELGYEYYQKFVSRNVNNYIAIDNKNNVIRKSIYAHSTDLGWHQDHSQQIVAKIAEQVLIHRGELNESLLAHTILTDFIIHTKVQRSHEVWHGDQRQANIIRYIACKEGEQIYKIMPPKGEVGTYKRKNSLTDEFYHAIADNLPPNTHDERVHTKNKSVYAIRKSFIGKGTKFKLCTDLKDISFSDIDYDYYTKEILKLL